MNMFCFFSPNLCNLLLSMGLFLLYSQVTKAQVPCDGPYYLIVNDYYTGTHVYDYDDPSISYPNSCLTGATVGGGEGLTINYANRLVYIAKLTGEVEVWDAVSGTLSFTFNAGQGSNIYDVALSNDGLYLYVAGSYGLHVFNATDGSFVTSLSTNVINGLPLWGVDVNPITGNVYVTDGGNGDNISSITIISPAPTLTVIDTLVNNTLPSSGYGEFVGIEFANDGSFWVIKQKSTTTGSDFALHYDANGNLIKNCDLNNANPNDTNGNGNAWDLVIGADGNLLVSSYSFNGGTTQVYAVDSNTCASTPFLTNAGYETAKGIALGCVEMICEPCVVDITNSGNTSICAGNSTGVTFNVLNAFDTHTITVTPTAPYSTTDTDRSDGITYTLDAQPNITTNYTIQVNSNGCMKSTNVTVTVNDLAVSCSKTDVTTNGGSDGTASVSASGGTSPYAYLWTDGETTSSISNKVAGTYSVTVTDQNGCTAACTQTIQEPGCTLTATTTGNETNVSCNGGNDGAIGVTASGNLSPVTYLWSNSATTASISNLVAGSYSVTVTESASCTAVAAYTVTEPAVLDASCSHTDVTTNGGSDGTATVNATGGTPAYAYLWNSGETTSSISNKVAGTYSVTVTDQNGCTANCMATVNQPNPPLLPDLSLAKTANTATTTLNGTVIFTLTLTNDNGIDATGVVVTDNLPAGVTFVSSSDPANVNVSGNVLTWNVGNMLGTDAPKTLQITVTTANEGSFVNTAEITAMNETDTDSTPNNDVAGEDDQDQACFSVPVKLCSDNASAMITITSGTATSWQWYVSTDNGASYTALSGETNQDLVINNTLMGGNGITKYFRVAYNGAAITDGCGATMCCPVIVTTETCTVCPMPKCIPITVTKN